VVQIQDRGSIMLAREGEELSGQRRRAGRGPADLRQGLADAPGRRDLERRQLHVAEDGGQEVVEVVGHATGELPDGLHLDGLLQLLLEPPLIGLRASLLGELAAHAHDGGSPVHLGQGGHHLHRERRAIPTPDDPLEDHPPRPLELVAERPSRGVAGQLVDPHRQALVAGVAQALAHGVVHLEDPTLGVDEEDAVGHRVEEGAVPGLAAAQGFLGRLWSEASRRLSTIPSIPSTPSRLVASASIQCLLPSRCRWRHSVR
jgi:hypothetical protein